jgi:anti-sigma factor RsiW
MSCPEFDCKAFVLDELTAPERRRVEAHLAACAACGEQVRALKLTLGLLGQLPEREPRPIRFAAEAVAKPGWWDWLWNSGPRLGFASAAMLSAALMVNAFVPRPLTPAPVPVAAVAAPTVTDQQVEQRVRAEVAARLGAELKPVMAQLDERLKSYEERTAKQRNADMRDVSLAFEAVQKKLNTQYLSAARYGGD